MIRSDHPEWPGTEPRTDLSYIGYWRSKRRYCNLRHTHPDPIDFQDPFWDPEERALVVEYLQQTHTTLYSWLGSSTCRFCGLRPCGERLCLTDEVYAWPAGFVHYLLEHDVRPPDVFIEHCRKHLFLKRSLPNQDDDSEVHT